MNFSAVKGSKYQSRCQEGKGDSQKNQVLAESGIAADRFAAARHSKTVTCKISTEISLGAAISALEILWIKIPEISRLLIRLGGLLSLIGRSICRDASSVAAVLASDV